MAPWLRLPVWLFFSPLAFQVAADDRHSSPGSAKWRCWYDNESHIICLIDSVNDPATFDTLPTPIPSIAREMRRDYGPRRKFFVHIPLHTKAADVEFTALLARSSVCGSNPGCSVDFSMKPPSEEEIAALLGQGLPVADTDDRPPSDTASPSH